jgi:hypothetical protein
MECTIDFLSVKICIIITQSTHIDIRVILLRDKGWAVDSWRRAVHLTRGNSINGPSSPFWAIQITPRTDIMLPVSNRWAKIDALFRPSVIAYLPTRVMKVLNSEQFISLAMKQKGEKK